MKIRKLVSSPLLLHYNNCKIKVVPFYIHFNSTTIRFFSTKSDTEFSKISTTTSDNNATNINSDNKKLDDEKNPLDWWIQYEQNYKTKQKQRIIRLIILIAIAIVLIPFTTPQDEMRKSIQKQEASTFNSKV